MKLKYTSFVLYFLSWSIPVLSQSDLRESITLSRQTATLEFFLNEIAEKTGYTFAYVNGNIPLREKITLQRQVGTLEEILEFLLKDLPVQYEIRNNKIILTNKKRSQTEAREKKVTISGYVKDNDSGESLIGASVYNIKTMQGTTTNNYGFYSLTLFPDTVDIRVSYVGYDVGTFHFFLQRDTVINISLTGGSLLNDVVVQGFTDEKIQESSRMGTIDIPVEQIKTLPAVGGEVDVLKTIQLLPGVQSGTEGSSGLYVRGGGPDQNLILLDGVPVYNASHLFGFFSVFNADAINHVELVKGGFPARYGGRLSSVVDISMKEGNDQEIRGEGSLGLLSSKVMVEGPIRKGKSSFIVSGRRTYADVLAAPFLGSSRNLYYFYDLTGKINYQFNANNRLFISSYLGKDVDLVKTRTLDKYEDTLTDRLKKYRLRWGNVIVGVRWNHVFDQKLFSNFSATFAQYRFDNSNYLREIITSPDEAQSYSSDYRYSSNIRDLGAKIDFDFLPVPNHHIRFGSQILWHSFVPGITRFQSSDETNVTLGAHEISANEGSVYFEDDVLLTRRLKANLGFHAAGFMVDDSFYQSFQPRVSMRYLLNDNVSLKASYVEMTQFIHLLTNAGTGVPTDLWVPSTKYVKPEQSRQFSFGTTYVYQDLFDISVEGYYKTMDGLIDYKEGTDYYDPQKDWQQKIDNGRGESYGAEFLVQRKTGKLSGWIGYTLSWTNRTFDNINDGKTFPYRYDRRHDVSIAVKYQWKENKNFSASWVYGTGAAITLPLAGFLLGEPAYYAGGQYIVGGAVTYSDRNAFRMRDYHRLDISYNTTRKTKWGERTWSFSIYNAYSRLNPFFIDTRYVLNAPKFFQYTLFPIIPSVSYRFKF